MALTSKGGGFPPSTTTPLDEIPEYMFFIENFILIWNVLKNFLA